MVGPSPDEEEAVKRNTDCVYFLASPLTCKKGSECEYRHSDIARVNPRDCWFWLHGNCLNPKCGFRHPPLDGLLGIQTPASIGHSLNPSQNATTPTSHVPHTSGKQAVLCVFFQNGLCLKGDWCPFLHALNSASNKPSQVQGSATAAEPATFKNALGGGDKVSHEKKVPSIIKANSVKTSQKVKPAVDMEPAPLKNDFSISRRISNTAGVNEVPGYSVTNGNRLGWSDSVQQHHLLSEPGSMNNNDVEEVSREPSPGFDVLVDDERRDSDYYPNEDRYGMLGEHEVRDEYDIDPTADYNLIADIDSERYQNPLGYDLYEIRKGRHALEQHRASSERISGGASLERRPYARVDSANKVDELDLRHRLNKRKRTNGLRSVISHEHTGDRQLEDGYRAMHWEEQNVSLHEKSLRSQLRGRIRLPGRSSTLSEKDVILGPDRDRVSPVRTSSSSRIQDRIKGRVGELYRNGGKNNQGLHFRRDLTGYNATNFTGPKRLAELKNQKIAQPKGQNGADQQSLGKRKHLMLDGDQQSGSDVSFEGPKPLEEILKRKRGENIGIVSGKKSPDREGIIVNNDEKEGNGMDSTSLNTSNFVSAASNDQTINPVESNKDVLQSASIDKTKAEASKSATGVSTSLQAIPITIEAEDDINVVDEVDKDGESDYGHVGGENYELFDGDNGDADGEYLEDDDEDDFAKKMGVMYS